MKAAGIHPIGVYIRKWQSNIEEKVSCCPIYELCTEAERMPGMIRLVQWWDHDAVNESEE